MRWGVEGDDDHHGLEAPQDEREGQQQEQTTLVRSVRLQRADHVFSLHLQPHLSPSRLGAHTPRLLDKSAGDQRNSSGLAAVFLW